MVLRDEPQKPSIEERARKYVGERGIGGDASNAYRHIAMNLGDPEMHTMPPARIYENYIRNLKYAHDPAMADEVMRLSDPVLVAQFDTLILRVNEELYGKYPAEEKVNTMRPLFDQLEAVLGD